MAVDCLSKCRISSRLFATVLSNWGKRLPEECVVVNTSSIECNTVSQGSDLEVIPSSLSFFLLSQKIVEVVHISLVMLIVVIIHEVLRDDWLKPIESIRQRSESHS